MSTTPYSKQAEMNALRNQANIADLANSTMPTAKELETPYTSSSKYRRGQYTRESTDARQNRLFNSHLTGQEGEDWGSVYTSEDGQSWDFSAQIHSSGIEPGNAGNVMNPAWKTHTANSFYRRKTLAQSREEIDNKKSEMPTVFDVKDWPRSRQVSYPTRSQVRPWVREELLRRERNVGLNYTHNTAGGATDSLKQGEQSQWASVIENPSFEPIWDAQLYKGPKSAWARLCSNAVIPVEGDTEETMEGFVMLGDGDFYNTYGFDRGAADGQGQGDAATVLGYTVDGTPHVINELGFKHRPSPGVTSVESEDIEPGKNFRKTTVNFVCWSRTQLDYLDAYFFQTGITVSVEWGWNTYPKDALLPLKDPETLVKIFNNDSDARAQAVSDVREKYDQGHVALNSSTDPGPDKKLGTADDIHIKGMNETIADATEHQASLGANNVPWASKHLRRGQGNYGFVIGLLHSFNFSIREDGGYDCTIQISCMSELGHQLHTNASTRNKKDAKNAKIVDNRVTDIQKFMNDTLGRLLYNLSDGDYDADAYDLAMYRPNEDKLATWQKNNKNLTTTEDKKVANHKHHMSMVYNYRWKTIKDFKEGNYYVGYETTASSTADGGWHKSWRGESFIHTHVEGYGIPQTNFKAYIKRYNEKNNANTTLEDWITRPKTAAIKSEEDIAKIWPASAHKTDPEGNSNLTEVKIYIEKTPKEGSRFSKDMKPGPEPTNLYKPSGIGMTAIMISRGRFFTFDPFNSTKPYYAGKNNAGGQYITVSYLIDIFNLFFAKKSSNTSAKMFEFSCFGSRCVAHPNIKSCDGKVLLIPNSLAPRWNTERGRFRGSTANMYGEHQGPLEQNSQSYKMLKQGDLEGAELEEAQAWIASGRPAPTFSQTQSFLDMVKSQTPNESDITSLDMALKASPRDDLHRILSTNAAPGFNLQHPDIDNEVYKQKRTSPTNKDSMQLNEDWNDVTGLFEDAQNSVRSFPDYYSSNDTGATYGYSGRIGDLFVNMEVIKEAVEKHDHVDGMLMHIMKQVSAAAGNIWEFELIGAETNTASNTVTQLVDQNYSGVEPVGRQVSKAWVFKAHNRDSIVRGMSMSVDIKSEVSSQVLYGGRDMDPKYTYYARARSDRILKRATPKLLTGEAANQDLDADENAADLASQEKYIVALSSHGMNPDKLNAHRTASAKDESLEGENDISYMKHGQRVVETFPDGKTGKDARDRRVFSLESDPYNPIYPKTQTDIPVSKFGDNALQGYTMPQSSGYNVKIIYTTESWWNTYAGGTSAGVGIGLEGKVTGWGKGTDYYGRKYKVIAYDRVKIDSSVVVDGGFLWFDRDRGVGDTNKHTGLDMKFTWKLTVEFEQSGRENDAERHLRHARTEVSSKRKAQTSEFNGNTDGLSSAETSGQDGVYGTSAEKSIEIDIELVDNDKNRMLTAMRRDNNPMNNVIHNQRLDGIELSLTLDGIEGLRLWDVFVCTGVPVKYYETGIFAVSAVKHSISANDWTTEVTALFYPDAGMR